MSYRHRFIILTLIIANITLGGYIVSRRYVSKSVPAHSQIQHFQALPIVELRDDRGLVLNTKRFIGAPLFIQFIKSQVPAQIDSVRYILTNRPKQPFSWLLITNDAGRLRSYIPNMPNDVVVVDSGYNNLRQLFNVPECCEIWFVLDSESVVRDRGYYSDGGIANRLSSVVAGEQQYSPSLFLTAINSIPGSAIAQVQSKTRYSASGKAVILMASSVCTGCPSGELIDILNAYAKQRNGIDCVALLPNTYTQADISNFKANLGISFLVRTADEKLSRQWMALVEKYGEAAVNNSVILVDKGTISLVQGLSELKHRLTDFAKSS